MFITSKAITSVDVSLCNVYNGKRVVRLDSIKRVRLPGPRRLTPELQKALEARMSRTGLKYQPQVFENGWYCACGAFHPQEENTVYCSECGCDRILLQNALNTLLQPQQEATEVHRPLTAAEELQQPEAEEPTRILGGAPAAEEPTRIMGAARPASAAPAQPEEEHTRVLNAQTRAQFPGGAGYAGPKQGTRVMPDAQPLSRQPVQPVEEDDEYEDERDSVAEALIRWVPPITAILCAGVALCGFIYYQFVL